MTSDLLGVMVAIVDAGRILLTKREDFEVWGLPGGHVDPGESLAAAGVREVLEETGLQVQLNRLVGVYSMPGWGGGGSHAILFAAVPVGGALQPQASEVVDIGFFEPNSLPEPLLWWHRQRIRDALQGVGGGVAVCQAIEWSFDAHTSRQEIYALRDRSGLSRQEFFRQHYIDPGPGADVREVSDGR